METLNQKPKQRVIDSPWTFIVATAVLGPLALPLLWRNPKFKITTKIAGTLVVLAITYYLIVIGGHTLNELKSELESLQQLQ